MKRKKASGSKPGKRISNVEEVRSTKRLKGKEIKMIEEAGEDIQSEKQPDSPENDVNIMKIIEELNAANVHLPESNLEKNSQDKGEVVKKTRNTKAKTHKTLKTRSTTRSFVSAMKELTDAQRQRIKLIGFGDLLKLDIKTVPMCLSYWLVDMIDADKLTLNMFDGEYIQIRREDVHIALGLPLGPRIIERKLKKGEVSFFERWVEIFGPNDNVKISDVIDKMIDAKGEGPDLVICFLVLFYSLLVESNQNGYANRSVTKMVKAENEIKDMDWCSLVIDMLCDTKRTWDKIKDNEGKFRGPLLFLVLFYVDRVKLWSSVKSRTIARSVPVFINWTDEMLKKRETDEIKGRGFGTGRVLDQQCINPRREDKQEEEITKPLQSVEKWVKDFAGKITEGAKAIVAVGEMAKKLPEEFKRNEKVAKILQTAERLLGIENEDRAEIREGEEDQLKEPSIENDSVETIRNNSQHPFWYQATLLACELEVKKAKSMKDEMQKTFKADWCTFNIFSDDENMMRQPEVGEGSKGKETEEICKEGELSGDNGRKGGETRGISEEQIQVEEVIGLNELLGDNGNAEKMMEKNVQKDNKGAAEDVPREPVMDCGKSGEASKEQPGERDKKVIVFKRGAKKDKKLEKKEDEMKRVLKIVETLKSPYYARTVDVTEKITDMEKLITTYVQKRASSSKEILFKSKTMELNAYELSNFDDSMNGSDGIIRIWAEVLNNKEKYKSKTSPGRVFVGSHVDESFQHICEKITLKLDEAIVNAPHIRLKNVDMIVIGVKEVTKYYMLSVNIKGKTIHVLDPLSTTDDLGKKYGKWLEILRDVVADFMKERGLTVKGDSIRKSIIKVLELPWTGLEKVRNSGICTMRHMETYMGVEKGWKCGLEKGSNKNIDKLKMKYINDIIMSEVNEVSEEVLKSAKSYANLTVKGAKGKKLNMR